MSNPDPYANRPLHPLTGKPCDYYWQNDKTQPRWYMHKQKRPTRFFDRDRWYRLSEVIRYIPISRRTLTVWCSSGALKARRMSIKPGATKGAPWAVKGSDLAEFMEQRDLVFKLPLEVICECEKNWCRCVDPDPFRLAMYPPLCPKCKEVVPGYHRSDCTKGEKK